MGRIVTLGDSLTQGFQHGAVRRTEWSFPAMVARALKTDFRQARFDTPDGGPLLDLELLVRDLEARFGADLDVWELPAALLTIRARMDRVEDEWERGGGTRPSGTGPIHHNLAVWGFEVLDALNLSDAVCARNTPPPRDAFVSQLVESAMYRTARRVFNPSQSRGLAELTPIELARRIASDEGEIENLFVALGSNNALASCVQLRLKWSQSADARKLAHQRDVTVWDPEHFAKLYERLDEGIQRVGAKRVFLATVPHVTVAPVTRGVSPGATRATELHDGYYEYYTRFWIWDRDFDPAHHPRITREDARAVDAAIDEYNAKITEVAERRGYLLVPYGEVLDRLAFRRHAGKTEYRFPKGLVAALKANPATAWRVRPDGTVLLDTRYFRMPRKLPAADASSEDWQRAVKGGLFSLDGVHPTTVGYGIMAHELLVAMKDAKVPGADPDALDWPAIVAADTLLTAPPEILRSLQALLAFVFGKAKLARLVESLAGFGAQPLG